MVKVKKRIVDDWTRDEKRHEKCNNFIYTIKSYQILNDMTFIAECGNSFLSFLEYNE